MEFQTKIIKKLKARGYVVLKVSKLSQNGYPDLLAMKKDCVDVWIEIKTKNDTLKELQKHRINELIGLGKIAFCLQEDKGIIYGIRDFEI